MTMYILARTASGRPSLQHLISTNVDQTACGLNISRWSRAYQSAPISQILCKRCGGRSNR